MSDTQGKTMNPATIAIGVGLGAFIAWRMFRTPSPEERAESARFSKVTHERGRKAREEDERRALDLMRRGKR